MDTVQQLAGCKLKSAFRHEGAVSGNEVDGWDSPQGYIIGLLIISRALLHVATLGSHTSILFMFVPDWQRSQ